jgi:hypothetical protein
MRFGELVACPVGRTNRPLRAVAATSMLILSAACAPVQVLTGTVRPSIPAPSVVVYSVAPPNFEQVALLSATKKTLFGTGGQRTVDSLVGRLSAQAAKLGANGIILDEFNDERSMSLATGIGSDSYTHNADISLGVGALIGVYKTTGNARAIYVPRDGTISP